jgi:hypothetical protein
MLVTVASAALLVLVVTLLVRRGRRFRRMPATIDGVRIDTQGAVVDEDLVIERDWRIALLMNNVTRKPAPVPVLGSRAVVTAGRKQYAGTVYLEREVRELNPGDALVVWVLARLSGDEEPRYVELEHTPTGVGGRVLTLRSRSFASMAMLANRHVAPRAYGPGHWCNVGSYAAEKALRCAALSFLVRGPVDGHVKI